MAGSVVTFRPEIEILVCCARQRLAPSDQNRLKALLRQPLDWAFLLNLATENGLLPLVHKHLSAEGPQDIPPNFQSQLDQENRESSLRSLFLSAELLRVLDVMRGEEIPAIPYKGPVLAARAYGNPALRQYSDLDIAIPQRFVSAIYEVMNELGYGSKLPRERFFASEPRTIPGEYVFVHKVNRAMVEVHTEFTLRHFPAPPDLAAMMGRSVLVPFNGREVRAFSLEDELLMLSVHGAKDFWARLVWVADLLELIRQSPPLAWDDLFVHARRLKASRMLRLGLSLACDILGLSLPIEIQKEIENEHAVRRLTLELRAQLLACENPFKGILQRSRYRILMTESLWDGLGYWIRLATAPAEEDWSMLDLPQPISRSYSLLRPLRLLRKYSAPRSQ